jgi:uncharacterized linocin/CFP29 family protein
MSFTTPPPGLISTATWEKIEADCRQALSEHLTARRVVDFDGPRGLDTAAINLGRVQPKDLGPGVVGGLREVLPLVEARVPFVLSRVELDAAARGAPAFDTDPAVRAVQRLAELEDRTVFHGLASAGIQGMAEASTYPALSLGDDPLKYADVVARALLTLDDRTIAGPYALVLGSSHYRRLAAVITTYPPFEHLRHLLGGPVLHSRVLEGGLVISLRGGDFQLSVGQDASLGYVQHDADSIELFAVESFTFLVLTPEAVVRLAD